MNRSDFIDYEAHSMTGTCIRTFQTEDQARAWLAKNKTFPGATLHEVEHFSTRTKLPARKRSHLRAVA